MKLSAKPQAAVSFVAALALGAAAFAGCTFSSSTSDDTDGGTSSSSSSSGGSSSGSTSSGGDTDGGDEGGESSLCPGNQQQLFYEEACQTCLEGSCCDSLKGCFNIDPGTSGETIGCGDYSDCYANCQESDSGTPEDCVKDFCDTVAAPGVPEAFQAMLSCQQTSCPTECQ